MKRLLHIEFQKIFANRSNRILVGTYFLIFPFITLLAVSSFDVLSIKKYMAESGLFDFPYIWHLTTYLSAFLKIFFAIVIVSMATNEYTYRTIKQNLIDGLSKKEFVLSKFYTVILFSLIATFFVFGMTLIIGLVFSKNTELTTVFSSLEYVIAYFVKLLGFFSFCLFIGFLIRRSAFSLGFLFIWYLVEKIFMGIIAWNTGITTANRLAMFFPLESMSNLIKDPLRRLSLIQDIGTYMKQDLSYDYTVHWYQILIVLFWTSFFVYASYALIKKRDL